MRKGLSQKDAADRLSVRTAQFISNIERGACSIPLYLLRGMISLYGIRELEVLPLIMEMQEELLRESLFGRKSSRQRARAKSAR